MKSGHSRYLPGAMVAVAMVAVAMAASAPAARAQTAPSIAVTGDVATPITLSAADLAAMPRATATLTHNGITTTYAGVWLPDILRKAGLPLGPGAHGTLSGYVLAKASDGYQVLFSVGELDPAISDGQVLVADMANDRPLLANDGTFRLVLPKDKRGARSLRMLTTLEVVLLKK